MPNHTHADLLAAIDKARENDGWEPFDQEKWLGPPPWTSPSRIDAWERAHGHDCRLKCYAEFGCQVIESAAVNAHLDTLRAILDLHKPRYTDASPEAPRCWECDRALWPCLTAQVVADALTRMGAL